MRPLEHVKPGQPLRASDQEAVAQRLSAQGNISVGPNMELRRGAGGICLSANIHPISRRREKFDVWCVSKATLSVQWAFSVHSYARKRNLVIPRHLDVDANGNCYVTSIESNNPWDHLPRKTHVWKILPDGSLGWMIDLPATTYSYSADIIICPDQSGAFVAEETWGGNNVFKLSLVDGSAIWAHKDTRIYCTPRVDYTIITPPGLGIGAQVGAYAATCYFEYTLAGVASTNADPVGIQTMGVNCMALRPYATFGAGPYWWTTHPQWAGFWPVTGTITPIGPPGGYWTADKAQFTCCTAVASDALPGTKYAGANRNWGSGQNKENLWRLNWHNTIGPPNCTPLIVAEWAVKVPLDCTGQVNEIINQSIARPDEDSLCVAITSDDTSKEDGLVWLIRPETGIVYDKFRPQKRLSASMGIFDIVEDDFFYYCCGTEG
jgi:hypothetical protein